MPGALQHSPADVVRKLLISLGLGVEPSFEDGRYTGTPWPIFSGSTPQFPDSCITVNDTAGVNQGRTMPDGERAEQDGIQIKVRSAAHSPGFTKARAVAVALDEDVSQMFVTFGSSTYKVWSVMRTSGVLSLGNEPGGKRKLFTVNARVSLRQTV